ncbi:hypothetical protein CU669_01635 [Paramagnetospirillum kuznetsovii]|uniref:Uncharacterized protein n=1 Tax=Paramagnetospirillum kuznetsovii TaxID=2053833 RepID=A0A364P3T2_9PROT|nr:hypothetical protein [Paramagnetospirillum kuznetsovii]RAU23817.1 hypothetical protein CU669_01635 [Paramagnetospirillum kuznetsovii]
MHYEDSKDTGADLGAPAAPVSAPRPTNVPEKFWDPTKGEIRVEALLRAYRDLERRAFVPAKPSDIPASPELYRIDHSHPMLVGSPVVNQRLHAAGFSQDQAQLVYDLAHECLLPLLQDLAGQSDQKAHMDQLCQHFGGESRWRVIAPQLAAWGKKNLPPDAYKALASSADGVKALHRLMAGGEPNLGPATGAADEAPTEESLKKMIQDPRYWKTRDPAFMTKVTAGFARLYGEG